MPTNKTALEAALEYLSTPERTGETLAVFIERLQREAKIEALKNLRGQTHWIFGVGRVVATDVIEAEIAKLEGEGNG